MKILSTLGLTAVGVLCTVAVAAPGASATTLEIEGITKNESLTMESSIKAGYSANLRDTFGTSINTCLNGTSTGSTTSPYSSTTITGTGSILQLSSCKRPSVVHKFGTLHISHISDTTNGTVTSSGAEVTTNSPFGTITCETGEGTHLGTLTGVSSGHAEMDVNVTIVCSGISLKWTATRVITVPTGLGVSA